MRPKLTYANVMVTLLAFVVLCGGGAYAAAQLGKNSVGTKQLKRNAVTGPKVKDGSLRPADFAKGALPTGAQGQPGPPGPPGLGPAFQASGSVNYDKFTTSLFGSTVVSLPVPPGAYFATASAEVDNVNATASIVSCRLINGNGGTGSTGTTRSQPARVGGTDSLTLAALFQVTSGQALNLQCSKGSAESGARIVAANIVAVQVSSVSGFTD